MTAEDLKSKLTNDGDKPRFIPITQDESIEIYERKEEFRLVAKKENWEPMIVSWLEHFIEHGGSAKFNKEQEALFGKHFAPVFSELVALSSAWEIFRCMYTDKHVEVDALYDGLHHLHTTIKDALFDSVILSIAKLLIDGVTTCGRDNLTFGQLIQTALPEPDRKHFEDKIVLLRGDQVVKNIKDWRHKKVSHFSLDVALGRIVLPKITYAEIDNLIRSLHQLFNELGTKVLKANYVFSFPNEVKSYVAHANDLMKNGARMRFLSHVSSLLTGKWDRRNGLSGALLIHPEIVAKVNDPEFVEVWGKFAEHDFVELASIKPASAEIKNHELPFE